MDKKMNYNGSGSIVSGEEYFFKKHNGSSETPFHIWGGDETDKYSLMVWYQFENKEDRDEKFEELREALENGNCPYCFGR